jgi:phosphoribosylanthranilate isomerase
VKRDPTILIKDILEHAALAVTLAQSMPLAHFLNDKVARAAVERWIFVVGEAANQLDPVTRSMFAAVPWRDIIGMRHRLAHSYDILDPSLLHAIAKRDLQELIAALSIRPFLIKTCGLKDEMSLDAAIASGANLVALNYVSKSPRFVDIQRAEQLARHARGRVAVSCLVVDASDNQIGEIRERCKPEFLQFHGTETPQRIAETKQRFAIPVIKAIGVSSPADLAIIPDYAKVADAILLDAKPPKDAAYPGGHGKPFDWAILKMLDPKQPFILSGGLTPDNVAEAITTIRGFGLNLIGVDVSSGVESAPGVKDPSKIKAFVAAARSAAQSGLP